jgi:spore germination protein KB
MQKEQINANEAKCLLTIFIMGSSLILGSGGEAKNDAWLAVIMGIFMFIPMLLIYSRLLSLYPEKDLFDILIITLGKLMGSVISIIYIWYAFHLGSLVLCNFGYFSSTMLLPETPMLAPLLCLGAICIFAVKSGIEGLVRISTILILIIFIIIAIVQLLVIPQLNFSNIRPFLGNGIKPVFHGGFLSFSFPFAETVLFTCSFSSLKSKKSALNVYFRGIIISGITLIIITIRNILVLGSTLANFDFPSYTAVSMITIGDFIQRMAVTVAIVFIFGVFIKSSICLFTACRGIEKVFSLKNYRSIVIQTGLLMVYFSFTVYDNAEEMVYWAFKVYPYYAFPMQVILPVIVWIFAEINKKNNSTDSLKCKTVKSR